MKGEREINKSQSSARTAGKRSLYRKVTPALQPTCMAKEREHELLKPQEGSGGFEDHRMA